MTILGTFLGSATLASSLFPGVSLSLFAILSVIAGVITAAGSGVYRVLHARWLNHHPPIIGAAVTLPVGMLDPGIDVEAPGGAAITVPAGTTGVRSRSRTVRSLTGPGGLLLDDPV